MAEKYCAFLRGINVNGISIKMDVLKEAFCKMNFTDVKTVLATGNVIFSVPEGNYGRQELKESIEKGLGEYFGYDAHIILQSSAEIEEIYSAAQAIAVPEGCHQYFLFCDDPAVLPELGQLFDSTRHMPQEQFIPARHGAFWIVPKGSTLESDFGSKVLGKQKYKNKLTSRNINTVEKICKLL